MLSLAQEQFDSHSFFFLSHLVPHPAEGDAECPKYFSNEQSTKLQLKYRYCLLAFREQQSNKSDRLLSACYASYACYPSVLCLISTTVSDLVRRTNDENLSTQYKN
jgi:hypothetical protein